MEMQESKEVEDSQAAATDSLLLFLAALLGVGLCLTIVGILPVAILIFGLILSLRSGEIAFVRRTTRFVEAAGLAIALSCFAGALYAHSQFQEIEMPTDPNTDSKFEESETLDIQAMAENSDAIFQEHAEENAARTEYTKASSDSDEMRGLRGGLLLAAIVAVVVTVLLNFLWLPPLTRQMPSWRLSHISKKANSPEFAAPNTFQLGSTFSVADELQKWNTLRNEGVISEQEFADARKQLLERK